MVSWIFPLTILPGIGLLIISSTNWSVALTVEINHLLQAEICKEKLLRNKIRQLSLINRALVALYLSAAMCALGGFVGGILQQQMEKASMLTTLLICIGMFFLLAATAMLIVYAFRAVWIKKNQFLEQLS